MNACCSHTPFGHHTVCFEIQTRVCIANEANLADKHETGFVADEKTDNRDRKSSAALVSLLPWEQHILYVAVLGNMMASLNEK